MTRLILLTFDWLIICRDQSNVEKINQVIHLNSKLHEMNSILPRLLQLKFSLSGHRDHKNRPKDVPYKRKSLYLFYLLFLYPTDKVIYSKLRLKDVFLINY